VQNEIDIHKRLQHHPNIMKKHDHAIDGSQCYLIMQLAELGDGKRLGELWTANKHTLCKDLQQQIDAWIVASVLRGLHYLHSEGIAHLDVKPMNLLLSQQSLMLSDFGNAQYCPEQPKPHQRGEIEHMAPEQHQVEYDRFLADTYCAGKTLLKIVFNEEVNSVPRHIDKKQSPLYQLLVNMSQHEPNERCSLEEALHSDIMKSIESEPTTPVALIKLLAPNDCVRF
jgi:serine/threonine protein kinase